MNLDRAIHCPGGIGRTALAVRLPQNIQQQPQNADIALFRFLDVRQQNLHHDGGIVAVVQCVLQRFQVIGRFTGVALSLGGSARLCEQFQQGLPNHLSFFALCGGCFTASGLNLTAHIRG